jgi:hypothetical protein
LNLNEFYYRLCQSILSIDKNVRFAGILDKNGKLLVCRFRHDILIPLVKSTTVEHGKAKPVPAFIESFIAKKKLELALGKLNYEFNFFERVGLQYFDWQGTTIYICVPPWSQPHFIQRYSLRLKPILQIFDCQAKVLQGEKL